MAKTAEEVLQVAAAWAAPISEAQPAGVKAADDARYAAVTTEITKLDSPTTTNEERKKLWANVVQNGGDLLRDKSKDFLIATYVGFGMYYQEQLPGLLKGVALLTVLVENFWPTMFPEVKRIKGRANALQWFIEKSIQQIENHKTVPADRPVLDDLKVAVRRLYDSASDKFGDSCPAIRPLLEQIERRIMDAGPSPDELAAEQAAQQAAAAAEKAAADKAAADRAAQQAAAQQAAAAQPAAQQAVAQQAAVQQAVAQTPAGPPPVVPTLPMATGPATVVTAPTAQVTAAPADVTQVAQWLSGVGGTVASTANAVRRAADSAALAYRMTRVGLYTHLVDAPPADAAGKTKVPPPQPNTRKQVEAIATNQKWAALLEETESALAQSRFWLDLHRHTAQALAGLGASHAKAREEVVRELATVLRRLPTLPTLQFADGTPFADAATQQWISAEVLAGGGGSSGSGGGAPAAGPVVVVQQGGGGAGQEAAVVAEARKMAAAGKAADAIAMLQSQAAGATSEAAAFRYRLGIGQVCLAANQPALAKGVFEGLERDVAAHGLERWEPALASAAAEGLVLCYRALAKAGGKPIPPEAGVLYDRVCRLDPAAALRIGAS